MADALKKKPFLALFRLVYWLEKEEESSASECRLLDVASYATPGRTISGGPPPPRLGMRWRRGHERSIFSPGLPLPACVARRWPGPSLAGRSLRANSFEAQQFSSPCPSVRVVLGGRTMYRGSWNWTFGRQSWLVFILWGLLINTQPTNQSLWLSTNPESETSFTKAVQSTNLIVGTASCHIVTSQPRHLGTSHRRLDRRSLCPHAVRLAAASSHQWRCSQYNRKN